VIAVTGSIPARRSSLEQQLAPGGRMFIVLGAPPVMEATLITRLDDGTWSSESLFELELEPLIGAENKPRFEF
jgi:protein-L-isoaspartate(D-aspartate) O-methyltransferase